MVQRTITVATVNFGRGVGIDEFMDNLRRVKKQVPGKHRFFGFQEVDEADKPDEMAAIKKLFGDTHRFAGTKTAVPIAVPRTFDIKSRKVTKISDGVAKLSPQRFLVETTVFPEGKSDCLISAKNTHLARKVKATADIRAQARLGIEEAIDRSQKLGLASWLTGDLNAKSYPRLGRLEHTAIERELDYIRLYGNDCNSPKMEVLRTGTVDLTIDGHDAHWARVRLIWS